MKENLAIVFPGQGSQKVAMLAELAKLYPLVESTFQQASDVLGYDLWQLVQQGPQEQLNMTEVTQPALLTASVAMWRIWRERNYPQPAFMTGHSLGEWSALVCAGVLSFDDAVRLVQLRGQYMQSAVPAGEGAMAAIIGLADGEVEAACNIEAAVDGVPSVVAPVNYNSPGQVVIAGHKQAVEQAIEHCKLAGAKRALMLPVSAPFHTSLMRPAADKLAEVLEAIVFTPARIPVVHNVTAGIAVDSAQIKALIVEQIYSPVRWVDCVKYLAGKSIDTLVECGPGKVLCGLSRRIDKGLSAVALDDKPDFVFDL